MRDIFRGKWTEETGIKQPEMSLILLKQQDNFLGDIDEYFIGLMDLK